MTSTVTSTATFMTLTTFTTVQTITIVPPAEGLMRRPPDKPRSMKHNSPTRSDRHDLLPARRPIPTNSISRDLVRRCPARSHSHTAASTTDTRIAIVQLTEVLKWMGCPHRRHRACFRGLLRKSHDRPSRHFRLLPAGHVPPRD